MMNYENEMLDSAFDDDNYGNASEAQILVWKTLINLVQLNLILYQKKHKGYNNKSMKMQIWNNIGASLTPPMTGIDAEKTFYRLRQKFEKECRKVNTVAGKIWRRTSSNFQPILKRKKAMASQLSHFSSSQHSSLQCATLTSATYPSICTPPIILKKTQM
ncbi:uncharacterized protein LOC105183439 isoform X1 [Harpegnathos saltator]|uniref:uncharacterized protein LOC112588351 isoform X1 n=1 Tax=Harpegnathos saltator TaxID=610380 RepID=UPI000DBEEA8D|nr:uncharacterized protein LOC112588351 isoform X1 [Harpegnathos saltator]XP_025153711.1 uncharacterized protein LOC105183439 isoform X1 [Harpegnathos saltator]